MDNISQCYYINMIIQMTVKKNTDPYLPELKMPSRYETKINYILFSTYHDFVKKTKREEEEKEDRIWTRE